MPKRTTCTLLIAALGIATLARADSITLKNGNVVTGIIKQIDGGYDVTLEDGRHRFVSTEEARSVKLSNDGKVTEENARERLGSLKRSIEAERDLDRIIERYQQFVAMNAKTDAARQAEAELGVWRERKTKGMLKVGTRWLTAAERDANLEAAAVVVDQLCALIAAGREDEAAVRLREVSAEDPENVSYLYLSGVLQLRREQFFDAKRSFDAVAERVVDHPPTLVNLGVLAVQFKRWPQAVAHFEQAVALAPSSQEILDNIFEFQQIVPDATRRTNTFERLVARAAPLEAALQERQARRGLFRLGSSWVDKAALDKAKAELDAYEKKKADLERDYQDTQQAIRKSDEQIQLLERMIHRMEQESLVQDSNGNVIRRRYPPTYWDIQRDLQMLQDQQRRATEHVADLRKQAEVVKANQPKPPLAGKLTPIDQRGVPVVLPASAATRPTSRPSLPPATQPTSQLSAEATTAPVVDARAHEPAGTTPTTAPAPGLFD